MRKYIYDVSGKSNHNDRFWFLYLVFGIGKTWKRQHQMVDRREGGHVAGVAT